MTGLFPWSETSVLVGVRASWGTRVREVLVLGGEPGSGDPLLAVETNEPATRAVRLEDGAVAVEDGNHRISFLPGTGIHLLPGATYDDVVSRPRFERSGDRSSWVFPGRAVGVSRRGEIFTCRDGVPIVLYRDGHIGRFDPPLPFGC